MKQSLAATLAFALFVVATLAASGPVRAEDPAGLTLFKKNGCNECHVISALGVEKDAKKKSAEPEATGTESKKKKKESPDLSGVGLTHEAKWISAYLNKDEAIDGEKHEKRFKGSEADRRTVAMWLATLKTEVKKAPADAKPTGESDKDAKQGSGG